jgi:carboxyl-terminal processing protease
VTVHVKRPGYRDQLQFTITRDRIPLETVIAAYMLDDETGYIKLQRFARTSHAEVLEAMRQLRAQGMDRLVFDLRGNAGGLLEQAWQITDEFLPAGDMVVYTNSRHPGNNREYRATNGGTFEQDPVIVLVDENSASASEIVAGALQDHQRALIIGERSYGKGSVQAPFELDDGSVLKLTTALYYPPHDRLIQASGITPDVHVGPVAPQAADSHPELEPERSDPHHLRPEDFGRVTPPDRDQSAALTAAGDDYQIAVAVTHLRAWERIGPKPRRRR